MKLRIISPNMLMPKLFLIINFINNYITLIANNFKIRKFRFFEFFDIIRIKMILSSKKLLFCNAKCYDPRIELGMGIK